MALPDSLATEIASVVGAQNLITEPQIRKQYESDWTGRYEGETPAVVRPRRTEEVAAVLRALAGAAVPCVPQGGNTGLVGGGVPVDAETVLSLAQLDFMGPIDFGSSQITVGAGVTIAEVQTAANAHGLDFPVDIASKESATVGGAISTNAGGLRVLKFGHMDSLLAGIESVLSDGSVLSHLQGLKKDNTGYSFEGVFAGAEGTLGVITKARLQLVPVRPRRVVAIMALDSVEAAVETTINVRRSVSSLEAVELMLHEGMAAVVAGGDLPWPFDRRVPTYLLVEAAGNDRDVQEFLEFLAGLDGEIVVGQDAHDCRRLWRYRETHSESIARYGVPVKMDVTIPLEHYASVAHRVRGLVEEIAPDARVFRFGHVADGNLHINVITAPNVRRRVESYVYELVAEYGGSISAEHGIGRAKKRWLGLSRSASEIDAAKRIKKALDPALIMNPKVLYE